MIKIRDMDSSDKQFFLMTAIIPILVWWVYKGRKKYGAKGMK